MQIEISTTPELQFVMCMATQNEAKNHYQASSRQFVRLFFVGNTGIETTTTFEDAMKSLNEAGVRLVAEVVAAPPIKSKKRLRKPDKKKT